MTEDASLTLYFVIFVVGVAIGMMVMERFHMVIRIRTMRQTDAERRDLQASLDRREDQLLDKQRQLEGMTAAHDSALHERDILRGTLHQTLEDVAVIEANFEIERAELQQQIVTLREAARRSPIPSVDLDFRSVIEPPSEEQTNALLQQLAAARSGRMITIPMGTTMAAEGPVGRALLDVTPLPNVRPLFLMNYDSIERDRAGVAVMPDSVREAIAGRCAAAAEFRAQYQLARDRMIEASAVPPLPKPPEPSTRLVDL